MNKNNLISILFILIIQDGICQIQLSADGKTDTFDLITEAFAPSYRPYETPGFQKNDCDNHSSFETEHIVQVYDSILKKYVFKFLIHLKEDNDRCKKFDRQRNEIKTYKASPENCKANLNETIIYEWKFKLSEDFAASKRFTHLHQIKAVGEKPRSKPIFTLTARKRQENGKKKKLLN